MIETTAVNNNHWDIPVRAGNRTMTSSNATTDGNIDYRQTLARVVAAIQRNMVVIGDRNPKLGTSELEWEYCGASDWVAGFWAGQLWLSYQLTKDPQLLHFARQRRPYFQRLLDNPEWMDHDLGFQFILTCVADYQLTGDTGARTMALAATDALLSRFRSGGKYIVAWNEDHDLGPERTRGKTIIDSLQNVSLLFWASRETGNPTYREVAMAHSDTLMAHIVRSDYSTFHTFDFDPETQQPVGGETFQGYSDDSCWSRGQSWAIHGYAQIYANTGDRKYLQLAMKLADYVIARMPDSGIPPWDYCLPESAPHYRDSSAGAITAAGMLFIAQLCEDRQQGQQYRHWGLHMLAGLVRECDISEQPGALGLLDEGASYVGIGLCRNMLPYGDYYYLEALMRASGHDTFFW